MSEPDALDLDEMSSSNAKAIAKIREMTNELKSVVEHEILSDFSSLSTTGSATGLAQPFEGPVQPGGKTP